MNAILPLIEMYKDTTSEVHWLVKRFIFVVLCLIAVSVIAVAVGVATQGAPNIAFGV